MSEAAAQEAATTESAPQVVPSEPVVQQAAPMEMQGRMAEALDRALSGLSSLKMPVEGTKRPTGGHHGQSPANERPSTSQVAASDAPPPPPPQQTQQQMWGPQQAKALQEILQSNQSMETELKQAREEAERYRSIVEDAQSGDIMSFAEKAKLTEKDILDAMSNGGKAPVTRPHVKRLETMVQSLQEKLNAMEQAAAAKETQSRHDRELAEISQQLNVKPEYGILKKIPDAAQRVQAYIQQQQAAARNRGEVAPAITVEQAATLLKGTLVESLKQLISDDAVRKELGLSGGESATPDTVKSRPSKAITGKMSSSGSQPKSQGYNPDEQLRLALRKMMTGA